MADQFRVSLEKESLIFSAAHFITVGDNICERLHGHNYRVKCEAAGSLGAQAYVIDFILLRDTLAEIVGQFDHRVLLPTRHACIELEVSQDEVVARFEGRRWVFPRDDCALLDVDNTTAERIAQVIAHRLGQALHAIGALPERLTVSVDENEGQWGICELGR